MAHAAKTFLVFNGGEWSEQLHGRTDLAKADAAGRKVRNFVPAQTGRLFRRKGLEYVGEALGECLAGDPRWMMPAWAELDAAETISPTTDVYGALGPEELRTSEVVGPIWQVCANIQYCDGPVAEGATMQNTGDRYETRWVAKLEDGCVYYRRVGTGEDWTQVPNELIAQPNDMLNGIGFCFDANARPCFASAIAETIHVWRWVADVPTEYTFVGVGPRLFFNGVLHYDNTEWDVVCYYCQFGDLRAAFIRENFGTSYTLFSDEDYYFSRVRVVDRILGSERLYIAVTGSSIYGMFRSGNYPAWPFEEHDEADVSVAPVTGSHQRVLVDAGDYSDAAAVTLGPVTGIYRPTILQLPDASDSAAVAVAMVSGIHKLVLVQLPAVSDEAAVSLSPITGIHKFTLIQAGSYSDTASVTIGPVTGVHAHV